MPSQARAFILCAQYHGRGVPTDNIFDTLFQLQIAGVRRLFIRRKRIGIGGIEQCIRQGDALINAVFLKSSEQRPDTFITVFPADILKRRAPFRPVCVEQCTDIDWQRLRIIHNDIAP